LSVKFSEALRLPVADGVNFTLTVQVLLDVIVAPVQVSALFAKSLAFVPPIVTVQMVRFAVPVLVTVSVWGALVVPTFWEANVRLAAERLTAGVALANANFMMNALFPADKVVLKAPGVVGNPGGAEPVR
jgi:hypothetical protein